MNIFVLDENPHTAARYHCDAHIHKLILESAQMASSAARFLQLPCVIYPKLYKPAYLSHPCTMWVCESPANLNWMLKLAQELEQLRSELGFRRHNSSGIIDLVAESVQDTFGALALWPNHTPFAEAMYARIKIRKDLNTVQKYQHYYRIKSKEWGLTGRGVMTYKDRLTPAFMLSSN